MHKILKTLVGGWARALRAARRLRTRRFGDAALRHFNDAQLRDIGLRRHGEDAYRPLADPPTLQELFPNAGGIPAGETRKSRSGPTRPRREQKRRDVDA